MIKLTSLSKTAGCAAKIGPGVLEKILKNFDKNTDKNLLVGNETNDDASVYKINDSVAIINTLDFFTPIVDDPYVFGQIAATNALSDVYAMGGYPITALNIVAFPDNLDISILEKILKGGEEKTKEANVSLCGGHSIIDDIPKYGLSVTGIVNPLKILKNFGAKVGDKIILTKALGTGIINTAIKANMADKSDIDKAIKVMTTLNKDVKEVIENFEINACTDITGFGLAGHSFEMAKASNVCIKIDINKLKIIGSAIDYAKNGLVPAGSYRNRKFIGENVIMSSIKEEYKDIIFDPQTSGGLLMSVPSNIADKLLEELKLKCTNNDISIIGEVIKGKGLIFE